VRDGSVSYQAQIQTAIDTAAEAGQVLSFPAMTYQVDEDGWRLRSGSRLQMRGAVFQVRREAEGDGAVFHAKNAQEIELIGGEIVGHVGDWADGVNVRGVHITGRSSGIKIRDMTIRELSSNGIGIFGAENAPIVNVWVRDCVITHCCNRYPEYLSDEKWEKGSEREDQGLVAFYFVEQFVVDGCRMERSRSDGTHFYHSHRGHITNNRIAAAKMGGYFLEGCHNVIGRGNIMTDNGSRGTTIERGSRDCIFAENTVTESGREGLWAPNCQGLIVTGNVFRNNGRKPNGKEPHHIWNANITINDARSDPSKTATGDYLISGNLIATTAGQIAAIRVVTTAATRSIVLRDNLLSGENRTISVSGPQPAEVSVDSHAEK